MSQTETERTDEGKSGSGKDDLVNNPVLEAQSDDQSISCPVPCSGALSEDMQDVKKDMVNRKINKEELEGEVNEVNKEQENQQKTISDLKEELNKVNKEKENQQKTISDLKEELNKVNKEKENQQKTISDLKEELNKVNKEKENQQKTISDLKKKLEEAERNTREWNLWLYRLKEEEPDNLKKRVFDICCSVAPKAAPDFDKHIDIVLRVGQKTEGKTRPIIMSFKERSTKELLLTASYSSKYLFSSPLQFKDVLTAGDIKTRNRLWPLIEAARKEGKKAFFIGAKALIDGKKISE